MNNRLSELVCIFSDSAAVSNPQLLGDRPHRTISNVTFSASPGAEKVAHGEVKRPGGGMGTSVLGSRDASSAGAGVLFVHRLCFVLCFVL